MRRRASLALAVASGGAAAWAIVACASLLGVEDIVVVQDGAFTSDGGSPDAAPDAPCGDTGADPFNCGACRHFCGSAHGAGSCVAGSCVFECDPGFAHCGSQDSTGCESNLGTDSKNCAACGRDCRVGDCSAGSCAPTTIAASQSSPSGVAVDATYVFWTTAGTTAAGFADGTIERVDKSDGGNGYQIALNQRYPYGIVTDAANVYWVDYDINGSVWAAGKIMGGAPPRMLAGARDRPVSLAIDATHVYWVDAADDQFPTPAGTVSRIAKDGDGGAQLLASGGAAPSGIAVDPSSVYWAEPGYGPGYAGLIQRVPLDGGSAVTLTPATGAVSVALDGVNVFFASSQPLGQGVVASVPIDGGVATPIVTAQYNPAIVVLDGAHIYWADYNGGTVNRARKDGTELITLATDAPPISAIAVDEQYVYWTVDQQPPGGAVRRVAK